MKIPEEVIILGHTISVETTELPSGTYGDACGWTKRIRLDLAQIKHDKVDVGEILFHEILHIALAISGLTHTIEDEEEAIVRCLQNAIYPLIKLRV